jgi:hypothetical protein
VEGGRGRIILATAYSAIITGNAVNAIVPNAGNAESGPYSGTSRRIQPRPVAAQDTPSARLENSIEPTSHFGSRSKTSS